MHHHHASHDHRAGDAARHAETLPRSDSESNPNVTAFWATVHCLTGCAIGEVLGMVIGTALALSAVATISLAVVLAFAFGYGFTMLPLRRSGMTWTRVFRLALAADTASITVMEIVDNAIMLVIPGAMQAGLTAPLFWGALAFSLVIAGVAAYPLNRWLIARGMGHAVVHAHHHRPSQDIGHADG